MKMNKNTVKSGLTRKPAKRGKRVVENPEYGAFTRRILSAYARRVANGDIEGLRHLVLLPADVDAMVRTAVAGLRKHGYSWSEIGDRLGVSKQAAQMRYGERVARTGVLDPRIVQAGMGVTVATLATVFADHHPGRPAASQCPMCGFGYPDGVTDCPTMAAIRPVLYRRRNEDQTAVAGLSPVQFADLHNLDAPRKRGRNLSMLARTTLTTTTGEGEPTLFDPAPVTRREGLR